MMPKLRRRLARKAAMEKVMVVASWLPPVVISGVAYYAIGRWLLTAIKSGLRSGCQDSLDGRQGLCGSLGLCCAYPRDMRGIRPRA